MTEQSKEIAERQEGVSPLMDLKRQLEVRADSYKEALPSHIKPGDLQRTVVMAAQQNPKLLEADRRSLILSCMKAAQDGLLPDGREAALVPFSVWDNSIRASRLEVQYMPMVYGLRKKIMQSDEISMMQVGVVYRAETEGGAFLFEVGIEPPVRHRPKLDLTDEEMADDQIVAAYSLVKFKDGSWSADVMRRAEINKIRELSQTGATKYSKGKNAGKPRTPSGPWVEHFAEMAKKTVMRRHSKVLPMSGDIFRDVEAEEEHRAALSATRLLSSVQGEDPPSLPSSESTGDDDMPRDKATGMTEVDEETARRLDSETGEILDQPADADEQEDEQEDEPEEKPVSVEVLEKITATIGKAKTKAELSSALKEWDKHRVVYDDDTVEKVDNLITRKRKQMDD